MFDFIKNWFNSTEEKEWERLNAYLDGALSPEERVAVERQVNENSRLQTQLEDLQFIKSSLRQLPQKKAPRNFVLDPAVYGRQRRPAEPVPSPGARLYPALQTATIMAAFFFLLALMAELFLVAPYFDEVAADRPFEATVIAMEAESPVDVETTRVVTETVEEEAVAALEAPAEPEEAEIATEMAVAEEEIEADEPYPAPAIMATPALAPYSEEMTPEEERAAALAERAIEPDDVPAPEAAPPMPPPDPEAPPGWTLATILQAVFGIAFIVLGAATLWLRRRI